MEILAVLVEVQSFHRDFPPIFSPLIVTVSMATLTDSSAYELRACGPSRHLLYLPLTMLLVAHSQLR